MTVSRLKQLAGLEQHALVRDLLGEAGPLEARTHGLGLLAFLAEGGGLLDVDEGDVLGPHAGGHGGHVATHVARADDDQLLADLGLARLGVLEERQGRVDALVAGHGDHARFLRARGDDHVVVLFPEGLEVLVLQLLLQVDVGQHLGGALHLGLNDLLGHAAVGDGGGDLAAQGSWPCRRQRPRAPSCGSARPRRCRPGRRR